MGICSALTVIGFIELLVAGFALGTGFFLANKIWARILG